jgi:amino acid permease
VEAKLILVGKMIGYCLLYQSGQELAIGGGLNLFVSFLLAGTVLYALQV